MKINWGISCMVAANNYLSPWALRVGAGIVIWLALVCVALGQGNNQDDGKRGEGNQPAIESHASGKSSGTPEGVHPIPNKCAKASNPEREVPACLTHPLWESLPRFFDRHNGSFSALAGIAVAVFTVFLICVGDRQHKAAMASIKLAKQSIDLANKEFVSAHPPKVVVRRVSLDEGTPLLTAPITRPWKIQYIIANTGLSNAIIFEGNATVRDFEGTLPAIPPFASAHDFSGELVLEAGVSVSCWVDLDEPMITLARRSLAAVADGYQPSNSIHFFGYVQYRDTIGSVRRTAFCRLYDFKTQRFGTVDDPDYEYS